METTDKQTVHSIDARLHLYWGSWEGSYPLYNLQSLPHNIVSKHKSQIYFSFSHAHLVIKTELPPTRQNSLDETMRCSQPNRATSEADTYRTSERPVGSGWKCWGQGSCSSPSSTVLELGTRLVGHLVWAWTDWPCCYSRSTTSGCSGVVIRGS